MPLLFFIDKDILDDPACKGVDDVVLSYTFFRYRLSGILSVILLAQTCSPAPDGMRGGN
jgi:cytochrome c oxidase assembly protein Cox11